ncbi:MAG: protein-(glutamine-N5) methyltransferase, release factor-specific [Pelagibacteraceae bacterium]|nr:protein-(glutamine-N5) methyltransferase, release factor-specific [Pelagibacteraceae bacterium]
METIKYYLNEKTKLLKKNFVNLPRLEARLLLSKILNKSLNWTYLNLEKKITKKQFENYEKIIKKKIKRFPTAYLLENKEFYSLNFKVNKNTLIPRPETEAIVDEIKKNLNKKNFFSFLDLGTGTGCILLSILKEFKKSVGIGTDIHLKTLNVAKLNCKKNNLTSRTKFINLDWNNKFFLRKIKKINKKFTGFKKFNVIVSNPPYLLKNEMKTLSPEVKFEPVQALYDNKDGLSFYKIIIPNLNFILSKNGYFYSEINPKNYKKIENICKKNNFFNFKFINDLSKKKRFILIRN